MDILNNKIKKKKIFSEESNSDKENDSYKINDEKLIENQPISSFIEITENKNIINNKYESENNLLDDNIPEENKEEKKESNSNEYDSNKIENCEYKDNENQSNDEEYNLKEKKKKKRKLRKNFHENSKGDSEDLIEIGNKESKIDKKKFIVKNNKSKNTSDKKNVVMNDINNKLKNCEIVNEKHEFDEENDKKDKYEVKEDDNKDKNCEGKNENKDNSESENESESGDKSNEDEYNQELEEDFEKTKEKKKKKKIKNSKLMDDTNPDEDKLKLKLIQISFSKKEYNIEEYIYECLKVMVPLNKRDIFLSNENIIFEHIENEDLKKLEILWFNNLTKNRQKSITDCFSTLNKLNKESNSNVNNMNKEENLDNESNVCNENKNNSLTCHIFDQNKEIIIVDYLVELCNQQVKLIKEYISYIKKNIYDLSSIVENNEKINEMKIVEPMKRRELFFYLNICISINYVQECLPNIYSISSSISPDVRGFNLHPMFSHINKKKEQKNENVGNPWEKLKLLKKGKKNDTLNINEYIKKKKDIVFKDEKENEDKDMEKEKINLEEIKHIEKGKLEEIEKKKRELEEMKRKKKALEEIEKKKKERADKKTFNIYSLLESAGQFFGEGPKYSNPNIQEFHKSNNNQLVYIKPPDNIDEKNILINFFLQFPSINKKLEYNKRRIYAENYGLIKIIKNNENLPINFELNTQPWKLEEYKNLWYEQNKLNNFQIWNMSNVLNYDHSSEYTQFSNTKTEQANQTENITCEMNKNENTKNETSENEIYKNENIKNETSENENIKNEIYKNENIKNENIKNENIKNENIKNENIKNEIYKNEETPIIIDDSDKKKNTKDENIRTNNFEIKKTGTKKRSEILTKKIKKICSADDSKQMKLTSFLSKDKINKNIDIKSKDINKINVDVKEELSNKSDYMTSENEELEYISLKKKKKKILDDEQINNEYNTNNLNNDIEKKKNEESNNNNENESISEDKKQIYEELIKKQKFKEEKKRLLNDKMKEIFELEAEESEDENIEDPEERKKAQLLKNQKIEENETEDDEEYISEDFNEFINNEEYNSDNDIIKLKHAEEMEKLEEDIFLKKFTYQGKEFNKELTNKEKLELERERQLLRRKKLLLNCNIGNVKLSDFESDSSSNSSSNEPFKNSLYESFTEFENIDKVKKNKNSLEYSYNDNVFKKGEYISEVDEKKKKQILKKIDDVIYRKEVNTNEGKKIVIKKKRKIRFHQDLSDITVTEEEKLDEYEKTKKKHKKVKSNVIMQPSSLNISTKIVNHTNKASIKWNNNIKDISELDTPTNGEIFKGFRKVENVQ
ncbi:conserved Plasmodium protein, unknown function [Plasmodium gallinaceum]|uniref:Uncharacterized protein n=1 Tax=Plasmodium gallinaceum TaxID=5849 RepID=A0A1J1GV34_PLAGA|nr:conserved Plasmodium protein, unknown function [Plasmodium gallinaceum]CRG95160.1 conserved Plasmodium protein, unknown function [Plasmodium gallinaceum]